MGHRHRLATQLNFAFNEGCKFSAPSLRAIVVAVIVVALIIGLMIVLALGELREAYRRRSSEAPDREEKEAHQETVEWPDFRAHARLERNSLPPSCHPERRQVSLTVRPWQLTSRQRARSAGL